MASPPSCGPWRIPLSAIRTPPLSQLTDEVRELLRHVFQTQYHLPLRVQGTGSAGMEVALGNFIESGGSVLLP